MCGVMRNAMIFVASPYIVVYVTWLWVPLTFQRIHIEILVIRHNFDTNEYHFSISVLNIILGINICKECLAHTNEWKCLLKCSWCMTENSYKHTIDNHRVTTHTITAYVHMCACGGRHDQAAYRGTVWHSKSLKATPRQTQTWGSRCTCDTYICL